MKAERNIRILIALIALLFFFTGQCTDSYATEPEDNSPYDLPGNDTKEDDNTEESGEDMEGKILIAVRKPVDFKVYSKTPGIFIVEAKNKGEITGYDIRVRKSDSRVVKNYRAMTKQNLKRRFIGGKENDHYKVKVRTFRTINGTDYPSRWTKELQVIILRRDEDTTPSNTRLNTGYKPSNKNKNKKKQKSK